MKKTNPFFLAFFGVVLMLVGQFVASDGWTRSPLVALATAMGDTGLFVARRMVVGVLVTRIDRVLHIQYNGVRYF